MVSSRTRTRLDDLAADITRGVLLMDAVVSPDHGLTSGLAVSRSQFLFAIEKGKVAYRIPRSMVLFRTANLWKALQGVGDATTAKTASIDIYKDRPAQRFQPIVTAPAACFASVDVVDLAR